VQLAGGKLHDRLLHSHGADDYIRRSGRDLKRDREYGLRNGLHFEPTRVSDGLLSTILPNWKINARPPAFLYFEDEPGRRSAAHLMTRDEARRIEGANVAKLRAG
jgi:hypothetical protein